MSNSEKNNIEATHLSQQDSNSSEAESVVEREQKDSLKPKPAVEVGGPKGPEPTRYGDWEKNGRCIDF